MDERTGDILAIAFVDKRETQLKSPNMEPLGLRRALVDFRAVDILLSYRVLPHSVSTHPKGRDRPREPTLLLVIPDSGSSLFMWAILQFV